MGFISIVRDNPKTGEGGMPGRTDDIIGRMYVNVKTFCSTVENTKYVIPHGVWALKRHDSDKHPNTLLLDIPHWSNILIHRGTIPPHSLGCVLVPKSAEDWLAKNVLPTLDAGEEWWAIVHELPAGVI